MEKTDTEAVMSAIPRLVKEEILDLLPLDTIIRFFEISKEWNALLTSSRFIYKWNHIANRSPWLLLCGPGREKQLQEWGPRREVQRYGVYCFSDRRWRIKSIEDFSLGRLINFWGGSEAGLVLANTEHVTSEGSRQRICLYNPLNKTHSDLSLPCVPPYQNSYNDFYSYNAFIVRGDYEGTCIVALQCGKMLYISDKSYTHYKQLYLPGIINLDSEMIFQNGLFFCFSKNVSQVSAVMVFECKSAVDYHPDVSILKMPRFPKYRAYDIRRKFFACGSSMIFGCLAYDNYGIYDSCIWELQFHSKNDYNWKEITQIPSDMLEKFDFNGDGYYDFAGVGEFICIIAGSDTVEVATYNRRQDSWEVLPSVPLSFSPTEITLQWRKIHYNDIPAIAFHPRPDIVLS